MRIHFVLIGEGSSDSGLIPHLEELCIDAGADEVSGTFPDFQRLRMPVGGRVESRVRATLFLEPSANLIFVHRDADSRDPEPRYLEISAAIDGAGCTRPFVAIVPVQETEAWLLLDEDAIRLTAERPTGRRPLNLPRASRVETIAQPKERLQRALVSACQLTGRRLARFKKEFSAHRRPLIQRLPIGGPLHSVQSWVRVREDLEHVLTELRAQDT